MNARISKIKPKTTELKKVLLIDIKLLKEYRSKSDFVFFSFNKTFWLYHCVKGFRIWSYSGSHFPAFGLNSEITPNTDTFNAVHVSAYST